MRLISGTSRRHRVNRRYLPGIELPATVLADADLHRVVGSHRELLVCVPSHAFRATLEAVRHALAPGTRLAWATKGFEHSTGRLPHEVAAEELGAGVPVAVLSGPTFAREVAAGLPTAMTVAASDPAYAAALAARLSDHMFRAYTSDDMIGVEVGGAVKNVLAIGAGISDGLGFGANTRIALITRGLVEMTRLGRRARAPGRRRSWACPAWATWCSRARTTSPATGASASRSRGARRRQKRPAASARWSRASSPPAPSGRWPGG